MKKKKEDCLPKREREREKYMKKKKEDCPPMVAAPN